MSLITDGDCMMDKKQIIKTLDTVADLLEVKGENKFKIAAFRNASIALRQFAEDLEPLIAAGKVTDIKGVGKGIAAVVQELAETGESSMLDELRRDVPDGLEDLLKVRGLGPKTVMNLYQKAGITSLVQLELTAKSPDGAKTLGITEKKKEQVLASLQELRANQGKILLHKAFSIVDEVSMKLANMHGIEKFELTGDLRRIAEMTSRIEFVLLVNGDVQTEGQFLSVDVTDDGLRIDDYTAPVILYLTKTESEYAATLFATTGSKTYLATLPTNQVKGDSEEEIYKSLGVSYVPPQWREPELYNLTGDRQLQAVPLSAMKGLVHFHTTWSDGANTLEMMANAAAEEGFEYIAVCDHSKSAGYAGGLNEKRVLDQQQEIADLNEKSAVRIFSGIESDILKDGSLDYADDFLSNFHCVVASVHNLFELPEDEMTARVIRAVENPYTDIIGHPTGRLLAQRAPYKIDMKKVIDACSRNSVAIEINAAPQRLDLDWRLYRYALEQGVKFAINPDAHATKEIKNIRFGLMMANKVGIPQKEIINSLKCNEFKAFLQRKVSRKL